MTRNTTPNAPRDENDDVAERSSAGRETPSRDAVSPVIGVILMVAITVILAAVIGTFVLGLGNPPETVQAGVNVKYDPANTKLTATYVSAQNADFVNVSFNNQGAGSSAKGNLSKVGDKLILQGGTGQDDTWLNVTGDAFVYGQQTDCAGFTNASNDDCDLQDGGGWSSGDRISITVTAVRGDQSTVVLTKDNEI